MKKAIVTGAAGFAGYHLTEKLIEAGYNVYAIVRLGSAHNQRLRHFSEETLHVIELEMRDIAGLSNHIKEPCDAFFHLAWGGGRYNYEAQSENISWTLTALEQAAKLSCKKFVCTGSQAEYGLVPMDHIITEDLRPNPFCDYGSAKVAAFYLANIRAKALGIELVWGRIFSLYGRYEPGSRMLPFLINELKKRHDVSLSSCRQNWDYLYAADAAEAMIALGERGRAGEIYNIANGDFAPLKDFTEAVRKHCASFNNDKIVPVIHYGEDPDPFVSLQPSVEKIRRDTGWRAKTSFEEGLHLLESFDYGNE